MSLELWHTCAPTHPQTQQTKIKRTFEKYNSHIYLRNILFLLTVAMNKQHQQALVPLPRLSYLYIEPALLQGKTMAMEGEEEEEEEKKSSSDSSTRGAPVNLPHCVLRRPVPAVTCKPVSLASTFPFQVYTFPLRNH